MKFFWGRRKSTSNADSLQKKASLSNMNAVKAKDGSVSGSSNSTRSSRSGKSATSRSKTVGVEQARTNPAAIKPNKYVQAVQTAMEKMNTYVPNDPEVYSQRIIDCFASPDSPLIAEDGEQYKATDLAALCVMICKSFPDFFMKYGEVKYIKKSGEVKGIASNVPEEERIVAQVELDALVVSGTHTGEPYTIAPGVLPELPPSGKYVENDEQRMVFFLNKDVKIVKSQLVSLGVHTGAIGLYTLAGGDPSPLFESKQ